MSAMMMMMMITFVQTSAGPPLHGPEAEVDVLLLYEVQHRSCGHPSIGALCYLPACAGGQERRRDVEDQLSGSRTHRGVLLAL